jgi:hypothetical protein
MCFLFVSPPIRCGISTLGFTIGFSTFLLLFVDWSAVLQCQSADTCQNMSGRAIRRHPLSEYALHQMRSISDQRIATVASCGSCGYLLTLYIHCDCGFVVACSPSFGDLLIFIYFIIFCLYWLWHALSLVYAIRDGWTMRAFYRDRLRIREAWFSSVYI